MRTYEPAWSPAVILRPPIDTLACLQEFPYNLEPLLLDRELRLPKGAQRKLVTIRLVMKQLLEALAAAHRTGGRGGGGHSSKAH
jgi:hypothetical protein